MIHFCKTLYSDLTVSIRWKIVLLNLLASLLSLSWLVQLNLLIQGFSDQQQLNQVLAVSTVLSFLIATGFIYFQSKRNIFYNNVVLKTLGDRLWLHFLGWQHVEFKKQQRMYFFDVFMVNFWRVRAGYQALLMDALPALSIILFILAFIFYLYPLITLLFLSFYALLFAAQVGLRRNIARSTSTFHTSWRHSTYQLGRLFDQFELLKMGRGKDTIVKDYNQTMDEYLGCGDMVSVASAKWSSVQTIFTQVSRVAAVVLIYFFYQRGMIDASSIIYLVIVVGWLNGQLSRAQHIYPILIEAVSAYNFLKSYLNEGGVESSSGIVSTKFGSIERVDMNDIAFSYQSNDAEKSVLNGVNLELRKGKTYLLKGRNGSGKTTLAKLLVGLLSPVSGEIRINGIVLEAEPSSELKSRVSYLHQDFSLFYGTAQENVSFGNSDDDLELKQYFDELMNDLVDSDFHIGDKGDRLSGGQRQRLALIREWGRKADLYILDEPLNHLDEESTQWLKQSIAAKKQDAIIVIISHLEGFESLADEILTMNNGKLSYDNYNQRG